MSVHLASSLPLRHVREGSVVTATGQALYTEFYPAERDEQVLGTVLLIHGLGEHLGRYGHVGEFFTRKGYDVMVFDQRGHGRSAGRRGHVEKFEEYVRDLEGILQTIRRRPIFLVAHSMGALVALLYLAQDDLPVGIRAVTLIGVPLKPMVASSDVKQWFAFLIGRLGISLSFYNDVDARYLSRNEAVGEAYDKDPLVVHEVTSTWFSAFLNVIEDLPQNLGKCRVPALFLHGGDDRIAHPDGSRVIFQSYPSEHKQIHIFEGCFHELLNEDCYAGILEEVHQWNEKWSSE